MQILLTPEQSSFAELGIQEGRFSSPEDAVQQALAVWEKQERARIELLASLDLAEQSLDAGEGETYTARSLHDLVSSIRAHGMAKLTE